MTFQEPFLNQLRLDQVAVNLYLNSGVRLMGVIESFDPHIILLRGNTPGRSTLQMVYKHAISSIVPQDHFEFSGSRHSAGAEGFATAAQPAVAAQPVAAAQPAAAVQPMAAVQHPEPATVGFDEDEIDNTYRE
ncbi:MAG: RNA chaperone Hfq [Gammaproteobacteria bacterium AqS3]|nr:RNA chaperone Hfq [Gammaproteobacteria bacterium AqS3]